MYAESLPEPLSAEEEQNYIRKYMESGDLHARNELIRHNLRLVLYYAGRYYKEPELKEELISEGMLGLIRGIISYDPEREVKLATYLGKCIDHAMITYARKHLQGNTEISLEAVLSESEQGNPLILGQILSCEHEDSIQRYVEQKETLRSLRNKVDELPDEQKELLKLRYGIGRPDGTAMTQREIAGKWGLSQSYISRMERSILRSLRKMLE